MAMNSLSKVMNMKPIEFTFSFADILCRRNDFRRDARSVGGANGKILSCAEISHDGGGGAMVRLWMSDFTGKSYFIVTVAAFFDPCFVSDIIIVPEFKLSFRYQWAYSNFNTEKIMSIMDELCSEKSLIAALCEWDLLCTAAAVCAVYEFKSRLCYEEAAPLYAHELLTNPFGDDLQNAF